VRDRDIRARFRRNLRDGTASPLTLAQIQSAIEAGWAGEGAGVAGGRGAPVAINWAFLERLREGQGDG
jgi:hypothetical protein